MRERNLLKIKLELSVTTTNQTSSHNNNTPVHTKTHTGQMKNILTVYILNTQMTSVLMPVVLLPECISVYCMLIKPPFAQATVYLWVNAQFSQQRSIMLLLYKHFTPFIALPLTITLWDGHFDWLLIACFPVSAPNLFLSQLSGANNRGSYLVYESCSLYVLKFSVRFVITWKYSSIFIFSYQTV